MFYGRADLPLSPFIPSSPFQHAGILTFELVSFLTIRHSIQCKKLPSTSVDVSFGLSSAAVGGQNSDPSDTDATSLKSKGALWLVK